MRNDKFAGQFAGIYYLAVKVRSMTVRIPLLASLLAGVHYGLHDNTISLFLVLFPLLFFLLLLRNFLSTISFAKISIMFLPCKMFLLCLKLPCKCKTRRTANWET